MGRPGFAPRAEVAARRARVLARRIEHIPYAQIAADEGISESTARGDYRRAFETAKREQDIQVAEARPLELIKLDALEREAWRVLRNRHIFVQNGKIVGRFTGWARDPATGEVVRDKDDKLIPEIEEIEDDAPVLQAIDRLVKIAERRARFRGLDAPARIEVSDDRRAAIEQLGRELAAGRLGDLDPAGAGPAAGDPAAGEGSADTA